MAATMDSTVEATPALTSVSTVAQSEDDTMSPTLTATDEPTEVLITSTMTPTLPPTIESTEQDTLAYTTISPTPVDTAENSMFILPDYTLEALQDPTTPQSLALKWLENDPNYKEYSSIRKQQRFSLATVAYATTSSFSPWFHNDGWLSYDVHECNWYANPSALQLLNLEGPCENITQEPGSEERLYVALLLPNNGLQGSQIPPEVALLSELRALDLSTNLISCGMHATLQDMVNLIVLKLGQNFLGGYIPSEIGLLTNLKTLSIWGNRLNNNLPTELGLLSNSLKLIQLFGNKIRGKQLKSMRCNNF